MSSDTKATLWMCLGWAMVYFVSVFLSEKGPRMARALGGVKMAAIAFVVVLALFKGCAYFTKPIDDQAPECERLPGPYGC